MEFAQVGTRAVIVLGVGAALAILLPIALMLIWRFAKHERFTTILVGALTFLLFAIVLEKPLQSLLLFPTQLGLKDHAASLFFNARPWLLALMTGLFPGVFEETGRLVAFKTVLRKRKNRETSISYGIGHGGVEVMFILGSAYITYIVYAAMINAGAFGSLVEQAAAAAPAQAEALPALAEQIANITLADIGLGFVERILAVLFHIGASILVFYACRDKGRLWLYPLAILLHTALDFVAALYTLKIISISPMMLEAIVAVFGVLTFGLAYLLLYKKDKAEPEQPAVEVPGV